MPAHPGPATGTAPATGSVRLGTRASALATTQSGLVADALVGALGAGPEAVELVRVRTEGDRLTGSLAALGGAGVFVAALREAVLDGRCDLAVHSLKDLPTGAAPGLVLAAVPRREDPRDVLCARDGLTLADLPAGARIGTGSPRRAAQLRMIRPDLEVVDIRGNVDTRLGRVRGAASGGATTGPGDLDAVVLAAAGLSRLGRLDAVTEHLDPDVVAPAPGQGALAVECRADADAALLGAVASLDHLPTRLAVTAERALLEALEAGCAAPIGALARVEDDRLVLDAVVCRPDGSDQVRASASADLATDVTSGGAAEASADPSARAALVGAASRLGADVAQMLLAAGAAELAPLTPRGTS